MNCAENSETAGYKDVRKEIFKKNLILPNWGKELKEEYLKFDNLNLLKFFLCRTRIYCS